MKIQFSLDVTLCQEEQKFETHTSHMFHLVSVNFNNF